jgi:hypothetical protein
MREKRYGGREKKREWMEDIKEKKKEAGLYKEKHKDNGK